MVDDAGSPTAMPMNTPQAKKPVVTSCSHSHGRPISRVTTSRTTDSVKPAMRQPAQHHQQRFERIERLPFQMAVALR